MPVIATPGSSEAAEDRNKLAQEICEKTGGMFRLEMTSINKGTASIENAYDETLNAPAILKSVKDAGEKGFSAVVTAASSSKRLTVGSSL
jgi:Asp/Glu/hydantoin racemase